MHSAAPMSGILTGCVLLAVGLVPGLLQDLSEAIHHLSVSLSHGLPVRRAYSVERQRRQRATWLIVAGAALTVLSIAVWISA